MSTPVARLIDASRFHDSRLVLKKINFDLFPGEITIILGENGAGKSTLLRLLAGMLALDSGKRVVAEGTTIGFIGHGTFVYPDLTAAENLKFWARASGIANPDIAAILEHLGLAGRENDKPRSFSRGMLQRLAHGSLLLANPLLILLDEPFTGLDESFKAVMKEDLDRMRANGAAIALVSHDREDRELGDKICRIANKKLTFEPGRRKAFQ